MDKEELFEYIEALYDKADYYNESNFPEIANLYKSIAISLDGSRKTNSDVQLEKLLNVLVHGSILDV